MKLWPPSPTTNIEELKTSSLDGRPYENVVRVLQRVDEVISEEAKVGSGVSMRWRIEIASALFALAIHHSEEASADLGIDEAVMRDLVIDLVTRRALEIWAQGSA